MLQAHGTKLWTGSGPAQDSHMAAAWLNGNSHSPVFMRLGALGGMTRTLELQARLKSVNLTMPFAMLDSMSTNFGEDQKEE
jgi:hypothetical protein